MGPNARSLATIKHCANTLQLVRGAARRRTAMIRAPGHRTASTAAVRTQHLRRPVQNGCMKKKLQK
jgi:hypothetical protein